MAKLEARGHLAVARKHLDRVQSAWDEPTDWDDLSLYGFYCLEAAVMAAVAQFGWTTRSQHPDKVRAARRLAEHHGLPDIEELLVDLNDARKSSAYGDIDMPDINAEDVAIQIERYVDAVAALIGA